jgi:hypothetical protein
MSPTSFRVVRVSQRIALSNPGNRAHILWLTLKDRHGVPALSQQSGPCHAAHAAANDNKLSPHLFTLYEKAASYGLERIILCACNI